MNKKIIGILLAAALVFGMSFPAFAEDKPASSGEDGLPDIDPYSWEFLLANSYNSVSLYNYYGAKISYIYGLGIDSRIYQNVVDFISATRAAGYPVYINLGHLSWEYYLCGHYQTLIDAKYGDAYHACLNELGPGCNEHQTGLAFDIAVDPSYSGNFDHPDPAAKDSDTFKWMKEHCAEYGFIVRYPEDKADYYGVACNGTHFRYVGEEAARYIMDNDLCLEEFLMLYGRNVVIGTAVKDGAAEKDNYVPKW